MSRSHKQSFGNLLINCELWRCCYQHTILKILLNEALSIHMDITIDDRQELRTKTYHMCEALLANNKLTIKDLADYLDCSEMQLSSSYDELPRLSAELYGKIYTLYIIKRAAERNAPLA